MSESVEVVCALIKVTQAANITEEEPLTRSTPLYEIDSRIITVNAKAQAEKALIGLRLKFAWLGKLPPNFQIRGGPKPGMLFQASIPLVDANKALDAVADGDEDYVIQVIDGVNTFKSMQEPCVRTPISLLRELRGQETSTEYGRRALVRAWTEDRRTGDAAE